MKYFLVIVMSYLTFACTAIPETPLDAALVYEDAVYETETESAVKTNTVLRWEEDIIFEIDIKEGVGAVNLEKIHNRVKIMDHLIPVNIIPAKGDSQKPNLTIFVFNQEFFYIEKLGLVACVGGFGADEDGKIIGAYIALPGKKLKTAYECLPHELMHAIGFASHTKGVPSTLAMSGNDRNFQKLPSNWDRIFINALYNPELSVGMTRAQAKPIIQKFMENNFPTPPPQ